MVLAFQAGASPQTLRSTSYKNLSFQRSKQRDFRCLNGVNAQDPDFWVLQHYCPCLTIGTSTGQSSARHLDRLPPASWFQLLSGTVQDMLNLNPLPIRASCSLIADSIHAALVLLERIVIRLGHCKMQSKPVAQSEMGDEQPSGFRSGFPTSENHRSGTCMCRLFQSCRSGQGLRASKPPGEDASEKNLCFGIFHFSYLLYVVLLVRSTKYTAMDHKLPPSGITSNWDDGGPIEHCVDSFSCLSLTSSLSGFFNITIGVRTRV
jgi:hypothetical protein